jgi:hypothetical protein
MSPKHMLVDNHFVLIYTCISIGGVKVKKQLSGAACKKYKSTFYWFMSAHTQRTTRKFLSALSMKAFFLKSYLFSRRRKKCRQKIALIGLTLNGASRLVRVIVTSSCFCVIDASLYLKSNEWVS